MKKNLLWFVLAVTISLLLILLLTCCISNQELGEIATLEQEALVTGIDKDVENMIEDEMEKIKEEMVELFYNKYSVFDSVADYIINTPGVFYCDNNTDKLILANEYISIYIEDMEIGEQLRELIYDLRFISICEDLEETSIIFETRWSMGSHGFLYSIDATRLSESLVPLDNENWYYFITFYA